MWAAKLGRLRLDRIGRLQDRPAQAAGELVQRSLSEAKMQADRAPFLTLGEGCRPTLTWPRQIPVESEPTDLALVVADSTPNRGGS